MLNPQWLVTFKTLVDVGHFTQTAEKLYMTQPGVTQHIKKLEHACGYPLITREGKSFELTERGRQVYAYAIKVAKEEAALLENLKFDNPHSGDCSISCSGAMALFFYPRLLELQRIHPDLCIQIEAAPNHKILNDIQAGDIDIGIVTQQPNTNLFHSEVLGKETLSLILPKCYENKSISIELLNECGLIKHPDVEHCLSMYFEHCGEESLKKADITNLTKSGYVNQLGQILLPVSKGLGFTVLPHSAVESFPDQDSLYITKPKNPVQETLYTVRKKNRDLPKRYQLIEELFSEHLS
ncbi:LysR family transcriptional regulator [Vibrio makurazakiensis]|uniref:LysR family transcriptional regulator n=1 Tax=Vibrio makurazakiensis TaxID=2910250 RepID=UPI003D0E0C90